jgi:penicillin-binding protein 1A
MKTDNQHFHLDIWRDVMEKIHKDLEYKGFEKPSNVEMIYVCQDSGLLATDFCWNDARGSRVIETPETSGSSPSGYCNLHGVVTIDTSTGMKANQYCPKYLNKTIDGIVVKDEYITDYSYQIPSSVYNGAYCTAHGSWTVQWQPPEEESQEERPPVDDTPPPQEYWETPLPSESTEASPASETTETPVIPPEFQNTEQLIPPDQNAQEQTTPYAPVETLPPSTGTPWDWMEPSANPPWEVIEPFEDQYNPVIDEPESIDNFVPNP